MKDRVLVVDDSAQNRMVAVGHLEAAGYEVAAVGSGEEALSHLAKERADLVILDVLMPGLGGFETCRRIRATPALAGMPVMFLTALGDREATQPALDAGADDLLAKPFQRAELLLRARALIRQHGQALELASQNAQLRKLEQDKRRMAQLIVHDLKGPTTAIGANAEMLQRANLDGELADLVSDILVAVGTLDATVRNLLDLSRAADVGLSVHLEALDLRAITTDVTASLRGFARLNEVTVATKIDVESVIGDRELLRRLVQNLLHNAIKHSPKGAEVTVTGQLEGEALLLRVSDTGEGVSEGDTQTIFDAYVSRDRPGGGHGLGLVFCRLAAEAHGGRIWVESGHPTGATFCVRIPPPT